jgi:hypothetical protein
MELDMAGMNCPVCGANTEEMSTTVDGMAIVCPTCGEYDISSAVLGSNEWNGLDPEQRHGALVIAKREADPGTRPVITTELLASAAP